MDFKNAIILTDDKKTKFLCPKDWIVNIFEAKEKDWISNNGNEETNQTYIAIHFENYNKLALRDSKYAHHPDMNGMVCVKVSDDFKILAGRLRGDKATEVLFGEKT